MVPAEEVAAFPDTNVFLHYRPIAELDWRSMTQGHPVRIQIAPVVTRELEERKTLHPGQARDALCIRKADCLVGRRLRDLSLRPVLTHDPAPQVNCTPRTQNSTQEARWRVFAPRVNHSRQIGI